MKKVKIGIIGCGAVTQLYHLPAAQFVSNILKIEALVDLNIMRAQKLGSKYKIPYIFDDYHKIFDIVDGVIVALPNNLHAQVSIEFLKEGIPVLCEKPIATNTYDAEKVIKISEKYKTPIAVGHIRRFYLSSRIVKHLISKNIIGEIYEVDIEEGNIFEWPTVSAYIFDKWASGGGVLIDTGTHVLDLILWWFGDNIINFDYTDDDFGGVEANCEIHLCIKFKNNIIKNRIELSRERKLRNSYRIFGEKGYIEFFPFNTENVRLFIQGKELILGEKRKRSILYYFSEQLKDFAMVILGRKNPYVDAKEAYKTVKLIEELYARKRRLTMPWITYSCENAT
jgi:predicted dehydrogenase